MLVHLYIVFFFIDERAFKIDERVFGVNRLFIYKQSALV
jgi:hypothetical protein